MLAVLSGNHRLQAVKEKKGIYQGSPKIQAQNGGKGLESTRQWMKPEDPGPVMNGQLPVVKEKQPWELGIICL